MKITMPACYLFLFFLLGIGLPSQLDPSWMAQAYRISSFDCGGIIEIPPIECEALVALYEANPTADLTDWLLDGSSPCDWSGVICVENSVTQLYLSSRQLTSLPMQIGNLTQLTQLNLQNNQISSLPVEIGDLSHLIGLNLSKNYLVILPPEIGNLSSMKALTIASNPIEVVPVEIGNLTQATWLDLSRNQLTSIPTQIGNLSELTVLKLNDNKLTTLPEEISRLTNLVTLWLHNNQITALPTGVGNLTSLTELSASNNQLMNLPEGLDTLVGLSRLSLHTNPLSGPIPQPMIRNYEHFWFYGTTMCTEEPFGESWWDIIIGTGLLCSRQAGIVHGVVTNPNGEPVRNAQLLLYRSPYSWDFDSYRIILVDSVRTNGLGEYTIQGLGEDIYYELYIYDRSGKHAANNSIHFVAKSGTTRIVNVQLELPQLPQITVDSDGVNPVVGVDPTDGSVHISLWTGTNYPLTIFYRAECSDHSTPTAVTLTYSHQIHPMNPDGGQYEVTLPVDDIVNSGDLLITVVCKDYTRYKVVGRIYCMGPTGRITDIDTGLPLSEAVVTLHYVPGWRPRAYPGDTRLNRCESLHSKSADEPWSQPVPTASGIIANPTHRPWDYGDVTIISPMVVQQQTDSNGYYGWTVSEGCWYVTVTAEGYYSLVSPLVGLTAEVDDLNLALRPLGPYSAYLPVIQN